MRISSQAFRMGWKIISNSPDVKHEIENKLAFRNLLAKCGIKAVSGETVLLNDLDEDLYKRLADKWGPKIVFQACEITTGGGTGTAFINSLNDFRNFSDKLKKKSEMFNFIKNVNVTSFIEGIPASISACATKYGVITGSIQTQILDVPEVRDVKEGSGLFSGHDFSYGDFGRDLNNQARVIAVNFGNYIYKNLGYKGIFGIDLIVRKDIGCVYPIECNPRYTDAFPLLSQIYIRSGAIPMDVFHVFEHLNIDYKTDVDEISSSYKVSSPASQLILETRSEDWTQVSGELKAGVYKIGDGINYLRPGYRFEHLNSADEFLVTEGVPHKGQIYRGGSRILRLIFRESIMDAPGILGQRSKAVVSEVYKKLALTPTHPQFSVNDFMGLKIAEIPNVELIENAGDINSDIINLNGICEDFGYVRPEKITWQTYIKQVIGLVRSSASKTS
jgi:hypothetical protein